MRARVHKDYKHLNVNACGGVKFHKKHWNQVPLGMEGEAMMYAANGLLEIEVEAKPEPAPKPPARRSRRKATPKEDA